MANTRQKNFAPVITTGQTLTQRPSPTTLPLGSRFVNETTGEVYTVVRTGGAHAWILSAAGSALPIGYKFSGTLAGGAGKLFIYAADDPSSGNVASIGYPIPAAGTIRGLKVRVLANTMAAATNISVLLNDFTTIATLAVGAGLTGAFSVATTGVVVATDVIDVIADCTAGGGGNSIVFTAETIIN